MTSTMMVRPPAVRVLCVSRRSALLVAEDGAWTLPRTEVASGESNEQAAARVLLERCGVRARLLRRVATPLLAAGLAGDWLIVAETDSVVPATHTGAAAFHEVTPSHPVGPLDEHLWGGLASIVSSFAYQSAWIGSHARKPAA